MYRLLTQLFFLLIIVILASCGGTQPGWYTPEPEDDYLVGIATEQAMDEQASVDLARQSATRIIAEQLNQKLNSCLIQFKQEVGDDPEFERGYRDEIVTIVNQNLNFVRTRDQEVIPLEDGKYKTYIKVELEMKTAVNTVKEILKNNSKTAVITNSTIVEDCWRSK
jgi:hypothetical protein